MCELRQLRVVANQHDAIQLIAKPANHVEQLIRLDRVQPIFHPDILAFVVELLGDDLRGVERAHGRARQDQIGLYPAFRQERAHLRRVALTAIVQWPVLVGQRRIIPTRLRVTKQVQHLLRHFAWFLMVAKPPMAAERRISPAVS